jgi:hypothetical protein
MGLFDEVTVDGDEFCCSEGHRLSTGLQTKDFGSTMGSVHIEGSEIRTVGGGWGDPPKRPLLGRFEVYGTCHLCPVFVQAKTLNLIAHGVSFELEVVDDKIRKVTRLGETAAEWLISTPLEPYMQSCQGPMPYEEGYALHSGRKPR